MKIADFFKRHNRYYKLKNAYDELLSKMERMQKELDNAEKAIKSIRGIQNDNQKLNKCISDACKECKYCVQQWTPWNAHVIVGCNKNIVCECFDNGGKHQCVF